jgi:hypothetical protein
MAAPKLYEGKWEPHAMLKTAQAALESLACEQHAMNARCESKRRAILAEIEKLKSFIEAP